MIQTGYGFGFSLESLSAPGIRGELRQNLDGDGALQPRVSRTVDLAHTAHPERRRDFIRPKLLTWSQSHSDRNYRPKTQWVQRKVALGGYERTICSQLA